MKNPFKKIIHRSQFFPTAITGLALGLCGIAAVVDVNIRTFDPAWKWWISIVLVGIAMILFIFSSIKIIAHPKVFRFELSDPLLCSFLPTFTMTLMCIAGFIAGWQHISFLKSPTSIPAAQVIGAIFMVGAVTGQFVLMFYFIKDVLFKHKWNEDTMYGSWFVPTVGLATAATFTDRFNQNILPNQFFQFIWYFAFITYVILFLPITYALLFKKQPTEEKFPSIAVYFAPAGLTSASFFETFNAPYGAAITHLHGNNDVSFVDNASFIDFYPMAYINVMSIFLAAFSFVYAILLWSIFIVKIFKQKFTFTFASLTFPVAINAASMTYVDLYITTIYHKVANHSATLYDLMWMFRIVGYIFALASLLLILLIAIKFLINLSKIIFSEQNDHIHHHVYHKQMLKSERETKEIIITDK